MMPMEPIIIKGRCLYTPRGAAREYAAVGCNFHRGCPCQCRYCYNRHGLTRSVMGVDHAVLKETFSSQSYRPKKYCDLSGEEYAFEVFKREVDSHLSYLRQVGIFFSFSTDPLCQAAFRLTWSAARYAAVHDIPVKILTKRADFSDLETVLYFKELLHEQRRNIALGFTLTGSDEWEPFASPNHRRIEMMKTFHELGYRTFASIEPVIDTEKSYQMIKQTLGFCDQYLIGLMSSRKANGLPPYNTKQLAAFVELVDNTLFGYAVKHGGLFSPVVYWKESIKRQLSCFDSAVKTMYHSPLSVDSDWSLFTSSHRSIDDPTLLPNSHYMQGLIE